MKLFSDTLPFYRGNLHAHTTCSDGRLTPEACMAKYREAGYDFLAITDHRRLTQTPNAPDGLVMIPGIELDFNHLPGQVVHLLGLGVTEEAADYNPRSLDPQEGIDRIRACGGLAVLNHPSWSLNTTEMMTSLRGLAAVEVWNSTSTLPYNAIRADSSAMLDVAATQGMMIPWMANDDCHAYDAEFARGWNMVQAEEKSAASILAAIEAGRFYATQGPELHQIEIDGRYLRVRCSPAQAVVFFSNQVWVDHRSVLGENVTEAEYFIQPDDTFVRAQVVDANGLNAWSRPIRVNA